VHALAQRVETPRQTHRRLARPHRHEHPEQLRQAYLELQQGPFLEWQT